MRTNAFLLLMLCNPQSAWVESGQTLLHTSIAAPSSLLKSIPPLFSWMTSVLRRKQLWVWIPALPFTNFITFCKLLIPLSFQILIYNGNDDNYLLPLGTIVRVKLDNAYAALSSTPGLGWILDKWQLLVLFLLLLFFCVNSHKTKLCKGKSWGFLLTAQQFLTSSGRFLKTEGKFDLHNT